MNAIVEGAKSGSKKARTPVVAADSAQSKTYIKLQYGLSEGEIDGLVDGAKSIFLDDTPIIDDAGNSNFDGVTWDFRAGTSDQTYMEGFPEVSNDTDVNVELKTSAWVRSLSNTGIDAVRIRLRWGALRKTNVNNGDVSGITIQYAIDVSTDGGAYVEVLNTQISDKTSANYERSHRIDLPVTLSGWNIRVRRLTPPADSDYISDAIYIASYAEVIDAKFRYPNTALLGLQYDAENFSSVAKIAVRAKGIKVRVPTNYDSDTRTYVGIWDGSFKRAYSNNPAWIYYDICTQKRYGLGERITDGMLDKASLYRLAQYCDGLVSDGEGGQEPRFTCNVYIQSAEDAYAILGKLAGVFRAISYWDGDSIFCDADIPQDVYFNYTNANVIEGKFEYSGTRARDRHTVAKVAWSNPDNRFKTEYEIVRDENAIAKHGIKTVEIAAWGCTSRGQAQRAGLWAIRSEQYETQTASFKVGLDGNIPVPGKVISIADNDFAGRFIGGRIKAISADRKTLTLDRDVVANVGDTIYVNGEQGQSITKVIQAVSGNTITVTLAYAANAVAAQNAWTIDSSELATRKFRVMTIKQDDNHQFSITALEYNPLKFDAIDNGAYIQNVPVSIINPTSQAAPANVMLSAYDQVQQGVNIATLVIQWDKAEFAVKYLVEWKKDDGSWIKMPLTGNTSVEIAGIYTGNYTARVTAFSAFDVSSLPTTSMLTALSGKQGLPPSLAFLNASGILFGMQLDWGFPAVGALDTAYTEIWENSEASETGANLLGLFAYPTNTKIIQGMAANVTRFYKARLVDRIGNTGAWSEWTSGTSIADAQQVLDLLNDQISESQLDQALRQQIDKIDLIDVMDGDIADIVQAVQNVEDGLTQERLDRQTGDQNVLNQLTIYKLSNDQAVAAVVEEVEVLTTEQGVLSSKIDGVFAQVNPTLIGSTDDLIGSDDGFVGVWSEQSARIEEDIFLGQRIDVVQAKSNDNAALIASETTARINADSALSQQIYTVQAQFNGNLSTIQTQLDAVATSQTATATQVGTIQTTVNGNTASIQTLQQSIVGINLQYTVKLDSNGYVAGFGVMNSGTTSNFIIRADKFAIAPPSVNGNTPKYAFVYQSTASTLPNGTVVPAGLYLADAVIGQISASKIYADSLSAISANLGSISVGSANIANGAITSAKIADASITTAKIADLQVDTIKVKDNAVTNGIASQNTTSLTIVTDGGQVRINVGINYYRDRQQQFSDALILYRDGVEIKRWVFSGYWDGSSYVYVVRLNQELPMIVDIVSAGTHTYSLNGLGTTSMALLEVKK